MNGAASASATADATRGPAPRLLVSAVGTAIWLAMAVMLVLVALVQHNDHFERVSQRNVLLARVLSDHATRSVESAALAAATIEELVERGIAPDGAEMRATLVQTLVSLPFLRGVGILDAQGLIVGSTDASELGMAIDVRRLGALPASGRDLLGPHVAGRQLADLVAGGKTGGKASAASGVGYLPLLRGITSPSGQLMTLVALINVDALANFQQTTLGDSDAAAALLSFRGEYIAGTSSVSRRVGANLSALPPFTDFLPSREHGSWRGAGLREGQQLGAFRVSSTRPLLVLVESDAGAVAAQWWRASRGLLLAGLAVLVFVAAMTWLTSRSLGARDRAQAAVTQREREHALTLQSLRELVFRCDAAGVLSFVNAEWERATGTPAAAVLGLPLARWVPPAQRAAVVAVLDPTAGSAMRHHRLVLPDASGQARSYDCSVMPLVQEGRIVGFAGSAVDVTERLQAQSRLETQLAFSEMLLESSPLPMSVMSRSGLYLIVNKAWENFTGRKRADVIGQEVGGHLPAGERRIHEQRDAQAYATGAPVRYDTRLTHADGTLRDVVIEKRALPGLEGRPSGLLAVVIDVTEFREAERATREARDVAEEASRTKSEFIANISHELRTPLQSIIGFSELGMRRAGEQLRLGAMFGDIHASGHRMLSLVNDLLDVARLESTVGTIHLERTDLRGLVREVLHELDPIAGQRQVALAAQMSPQPMRAKVDPLRFQQVVRNVLANALKFSPAGATVEVDVCTAMNGDWLVAVADRGPGIPASELETIFEAFVQSSTTKDGSGGTGLGLAICRKIMQAHGGSVLALQREGGGSVFEIRLPGGTADTQPAELA